MEVVRIQLYLSEAKFLDGSSDAKSVLLEFQKVKTT